MSLTDLFETKIFTPGRIGRLVAHVLRHGVQLSNVMHMGAHPDVIAIVQNGKHLTYKELFSQSASVSGYIYLKYHIKQGSNVLVVLDNTIPSIVLLFALSSLGCNIHIAGSARAVDSSKYDFVFTDIDEAFWSEALDHKKYEPFVRKHTRISIFTSGSTGLAKGAKRSNTLVQYLDAIGDIVNTLHLQDYKSLVLPVPVYHSYGLSALFLSLMMNKTIYLVNKFKADEVASIINENNVEVAILVPQMIHRLTDFEIKSLRCIASCSDVLPLNVLNAARTKFGDVIFNLYGTSETGLATIATPAMLKEQPNTIGRAVDGCKLEVRTEEGNPMLYVKSGFAMKRGYLKTGDLAIIDDRGWYYLHGRADHLLVLNGVNVYPSEIIEMAYENEVIQHVELKSFYDEHGFKRVKLIVRAKGDAEITEHQFKDWWVSKYDTKFLPAVVEIVKGDDNVKLMIT